MNAHEIAEMIRKDAQYFQNELGVVDSCHTALILRRYIPQEDHDGHYSMLMTLADILDHTDMEL